VEETGEKGKQRGQTQVKRQFSRAAPSHLLRAKAAWRACGQSPLLIWAGRMGSGAWRVGPAACASDWCAWPSSPKFQTLGPAPAPAQKEPERGISWSTRDDGADKLSCAGGQQQRALAADRSLSQHRASSPAAHGWADGAAQMRAAQL
jgi:hypothetical protein